jgi:hypothetical protein
LTRPFGRLQPGKAMLRAAFVLVLIIALPASGCGSSSPAKTTRAVNPPRPPGWHVVSTRTFRGRTVGSIGGTVANPRAIEVRVDTTPRVTSQVDYSIDCELSATHPVFGTIRASRTPLTAAIPVPTNARSCFVAITVSKSASAKMTLTFLIRTGPAP